MDINESYRRALCVDKEGFTGNIAFKCCNCLTVLPLSYFTVFQTETPLFFASPF